MLKHVFKVLGAIVAIAAIGAAYAGLYLGGASPFELVVVTVLILLAIAVVALVLHLRALHRALFQHAQIAYKGFMLNFFLEVRALMRDRAVDSVPANARATSTAANPVAMFFMICLFPLHRTLRARKNPCGSNAWKVAQAIADRCLESSFR